MKKHLLLGSALVAAISAFPQAASHRQSRTTVINMSQMMAEKFAIMNKMEERAQPLTSSQTIPQDDAPVAGLRTANTNSQAPVSWNAFTGSMNMFGVLVSTSRPLQYDDELNAVTFVHRKSNSYVPSPVPTSVGANTGVLVAMVSQNWGGSWDSTMIYNDNNNWARYPQGGILKGPTTTNIANAYIVATAPITQANTALGWIGDIVATKQLGPGTYNNVQAASNQTFIANTSPYTLPANWNVTGNNNKMDFVRHDFIATDDGRIRAMGQIFGGSANGTSAAAQDYRGARIVKGEFTSGGLVFSHDSLVPDNDFQLRYNQDGERLLASTQGMAWSEDGTTGYAYFIGARQNAVGSNAGYQPLVYKTTTGGATWQTIPAIDFNLPAFKAPVIDHLYGTRADTNLVIPFFAYWEGMSAVVDSAKNLHLVSMIVHTPAADPDSANFFSRITNYDGENYLFVHIPGIRPYVYDFTYNNAQSNWKVTMIDSLQSEGPGTRPSDDGYLFNQWNFDVDGNKIDIDARLQVSRTVDGKHIIYTWAETDTVATTTAGGDYLKWNQFPNVKARYMHAASGLVSPTEINVSKLTDGSGNTNTQVEDHAYNHYASTKCAVDPSSSSNEIVIHLPITVSRNVALDPGLPAVHRYAAPLLAFQRPVSVPQTTTGINSPAMTSASNSNIYPNPASNNAFLAIDLKKSSDVTINVMNTVGQVVKSTKANGQVGANNINIDLSGLSKGVYLVKINAENASATKKLVIE